MLVHDVFLLCHFFPSLSLSRCNGAPLSDELRERERREKSERKKVIFSFSLSRFFSRSFSLFSCWRRRTIL